MRTTRYSLSKSIQATSRASPSLEPLSLSSWRRDAVFLLQQAYQVIDFSFQWDERNLFVAFIVWGLPLDSSELCKAFVGFNNETFGGA
jgi:hypothetical protein